MARNRRFKIVESFLLNGVKMPAGVVVELEHKIAELKSIKGYVEEVAHDAPLTNDDKLREAREKYKEGERLADTPKAEEKKPEPAPVAPAAPTPSPEAPAPDKEPDVPPATTQEPAQTPTA